MDECAKRIPAELSRQVLHPNPGADVPDISWIGESKTAIHAPHRFLQQPLVLWVTTDDPIECDDVGGKKLMKMADVRARPDAYTVWFRQYLDKYGDMLGEWIGKSRTVQP